MPKPSRFLLLTPLSRAAWEDAKTLYQAIDGTHIHHEQTYDLMSDRNIPWNRKKGMPGFDEHQVNGEEIEQLTAYLKALRKAE